LAEAIRLVERDRLIQSFALLIANCNDGVSSAAPCFSSIESHGAEGGLVWLEEAL